ncbi:MAG: cupredoxin domain-containing protein [Acidimicrobiia bacterium]
MRRRRSFGLLIVMGLVATACTGGDTSSFTTAAPTGTTSQVANLAVVGPLDEGLSGYDMDAVAWNGYWYSRYNLGNLAMMSGLGVTFEPPMEGVMAMAAAVDQGPENGEHVVMPTNAALLQAVYAGGRPEFANEFNGDPMDFTNWRWDPTSFDTRLIPSAQAQTIIKEVEWAKLFNNGGWAGAVDDDFGAMDRFKGMVLFTEAKMQSQFALDNLRNSDGLFVKVARYADDGVVHEDATADIADQYQMLQALSDVRLVLESPDAFNGVYADDSFLEMLGPEVDGLFGIVSELEPSTVTELGLGAQAMVWFAATTRDDALRQAAMVKLAEFGDALVTADRSGVVDRARSIRGLVEAARVLGTSSYVDAALADFVEMHEAYDPATGSFDGVGSLTAWEVGDIIGALNSLRLNLNESVDRSVVESMLVGFFEATVNMGGLMRAVIPKEMEASPFEQARLDNDVYFAYPGIPTPDGAGGPNGTAAVDVAEISFDSAAGLWDVSDDGFVTASAMHASNEMFWIWGFQDGFPKIPGAPGLGTAPAAQSEGTVIEIVATEFAFNPSSLDLPAGETVTLRLRNDGAIAHNLEIADLGVFVEADAGQETSVTFTVPESGASTFLCNIPGHRDAGMEGVFEITGG